MQAGAHARKAGRTAYKTAGFVSVSNFMEIALGNAVQGPPCHGEQKRDAWRSHAGARASIVAFCDSSIP